MQSGCAEVGAATVTAAPNENEKTTKTAATAALNLLVMGTPREDRRKDAPRSEHPRRFPGKQ
jgi:hypothetical protein